MAQDRDKSFLGRFPVLHSIVVIVVGVVLILLSTHQDIVAAIGSWAIILKELGFACLVSVVVWVFFEYAVSVRQDEKVDNRIEQIAGNVFRGVFRRSLPESLIEATIENCLESDIVRRALKLTYTLYDDTYTDQDGKHCPYVRLKARGDFLLRNVCSTSVEIPIGVGLPDPILPELREKLDVLSIKAGPPGNMKELDLEPAKKKMREQFSKDASRNLEDFPLVYCEPVSNYEIPAGAEIQVVAEYEMAKEVEDTEILQCKYPTESIELIVVDTSPEKRIVRAREIHPKQLERISDDDQPTARIYRLNSYALPHQGVSIFWKRAPRANKRKGKSGEAKAR